ncbi:MAG: flavodoxin family protein [Alphaproteobacteria bacterium]
MTTAVTDITQYDVVFLGSPNWWGTITPQVSSFLETYRLNGKKSYPVYNTWWRRCPTYGYRHNGTVSGLRREQQCLDWLRQPYNRPLRLAERFGFQQLNLTSLNRKPCKCRAFCLMAER